MKKLVDLFLAFADEMTNEERPSGWVPRFPVLPASTLFYIFCSAHQLDVPTMTGLRTYLESKGVL